MPLSSATTDGPDLETRIGQSHAPCLVVAHPDDESLWCAGLIIRYPKDWLIVCCTIPFKDPERADKFFDACDVLGAQSLLLGHPERNGPIPKPDIRGRDLVISHGPHGEYGHPQHRELHRLMQPDIWCAYGDQADAVLALSESEWQQKLAALRCYDHYSPADNGKRKSEALIDFYGRKYDLKREPYGLSNARTNGAEAKSNTAPRLDWSVSS